MERAAQRPTKATEPRDDHEPRVDGHGVLVEEARPAEDRKQLGLAR
jgi:hypothetical protein